MVPKPRGLATRGGEAAREVALDRGRRRRARGLQHDVVLCVLGTLRSTDAAVPVIVPTFILPLVRQVFEDAYDKPFEEVMRTVDDYSQFDSTPSPDCRR